MQKQKQNMALGAVLLALVLCITGLVPPLTAAAVNTVDTSRKCTLTVQTPTNAFDELREPNRTFTAKLYRVADMNSDGSVGTEDGKGTGAFAEVDVSAYTSDASTEDLEKLAATIKETVEKTPTIQAEKTIEIKGGKSASVTDLPVGLYLLLPETVNFGKYSSYEYQFAPSLFTLPTTVQIENPNYVEDTSLVEDEYLHDLTYDASITLKPIKVDLFGTLRIEKELSNYRADLGTASFVFNIEAKRDNEIVYSNVAAIEFSGPGTKHVDLPNIPAGSAVTVTEVYSGAAYTPEENSSTTRTIPQMPANTTVDSETTAHFANTYDNTQGWGTSVVNPYTYNKDADSPAWNGPSGTTTKSTKPTTAG